MTSVIHKRPQALLDLACQAEFIARDSSAAAERLVAAANATFIQLCEFPELGTAIVSDDPRLTDLRFRAIKGFRYHLVVYRATSDGIDVVRVLHAARNWATILDES